VRAQALAAAGCGGAQKGVWWIECLRRGKLLLLLVLLLLVLLLRALLWL
jgi:hypothetical protein